MTSQCPPTRTLVSFADDTCADPAVAAHIGGCDRCRASVEEFRESNAFLAGVSTALRAQESNEPVTNGEAAAVVPDPVAGYEIQEEIHRGGQGIVYRAVQTRTRRTVAIKMLLGGRSSTERQRERFEREIRIAAALRHPNIVTVHESGFVSDGRYGLVMEYIEGVPLDRWSRSLDGARGREARRRALRERLRVMVKVCDAVANAHQHSIVHRDLKPANILVDTAGEPHILDFGIARETGPDSLSRLTLTGEFAGTLAYASPEQVGRDPSLVDTRTDIYSLGVIMYELVSGRMPYEFNGPVSQTLRSIESAEPAPLGRNTRDPDEPWVDGEVATIILKAMAKDPARRYQTAASLRNDIARYLTGDAIEARRDSTWYVLRKAATRHRAIATAASLIFALLVIFGGAMTWQARRLDVRGSQLAGALSARNVEWGRSLAAIGNTANAEEAVFSELMAAGVTRIDGPEAGFAGSPEALHAYWGSWDVFRSSGCVATLRPVADGEQREPKLLYFDQGGQRLNALDARGKLTSWSVATWEAVRDASLFAPADDQRFRAALSPDGHIAIFGSGTIRVFDPESGTIVAHADAPEDEALFGAFSSDGTRLATCGRGNRIRIRDARSLALVRAMAEDPGAEPDESAWAAPAFTLDGRHVAAACVDGALGVWNTATGALERTTRAPPGLDEIAGHIGRCRAIACASDGTIASIWANHYVVVWPADGGEARLHSEPGGYLASIAFQPGSNDARLVTTGSTPGGQSGFTTISETLTGAQVARFNHPLDSTSLAISPDASLLVSGMTDGVVQVHEAAPEPCVTPLQEGRVWLGSKSALNPDGKRLALTRYRKLPTSEQDEIVEQDLVLIDVATRATITQFHRTGPEIIAIEFARDGASLFEADASGRTRQWDLSSESYVQEFTYPESLEIDTTPLTYISHQLRLSPDGRTLARAQDDGLIGLWDVASGRWLGVLDSGTKNHAVIDFSPDGSMLVAHHPTAIVIWDVQTRRQKSLLPIELCASNAVRWSPDGSRIARSVTGRLVFMDPATGRTLSECSDGTAGMAMAFQSQGGVIISSAYDASIRLWDTRTGAELLALRKHKQFIRWLLLSPDGNTLISGDWIGNVLVWDLSYYNERVGRELEYRVSHANGP